MKIPKEITVAYRFEIWFKQIYGNNVKPDSLQYKLIKQAYVCGVYDGLSQPPTFVKGFGLPNTLKIMEENKQECINICMQPVTTEPSKTSLDLSHSE